MVNISGPLLAVPSLGGTLSQGCDHVTLSVLTVWEKFSVAQGDRNVVKGLIISSPSLDLSTEVTLTYGYP
jgi:hypothetical protein